MNSVLQERAKIYDHIYGSQSNCTWLTNASHKDSEKCCIAKDTIQDTGEALLAHRSTGFHGDVRQRYIEYYGVLQAVYMQQDSIFTLYKLFGPQANLDFSLYPAWSKLRDLRNDTVGHPVGKLKRLNRSAISYGRVNYQYWPSEDLSTLKSTDVNLARELDNYEQEAATILKLIVSEMSNSCSLRHV
jgi:hypothetical protein